LYPIIFGQSPQSTASQKVPSTPFSQENATPSDSREYDYEQEVQENDDNWREQQEIEREVEAQYNRESWEDTN